MKARRVFVLIIITMVLSQLFTVPALLFADDPRDVLNLDPPLVEFTGSSFKVFYSGSEITDLNNIPQDADIEISYSFDVLDAINPADDVKAGDYFNVILPSELTSISSYEPLVGQPLSFTYGEQEYTIGMLNISAEGVANVTFTEDIENLSEVSVTFGIEGKFDADDIPDGTNVSFSIVAGGTIYIIGFEDEEPPPPEVTVEKSGSYNTVTNEITWTVTVSGEPEVTIANVYVLDTPGINQSYKAGSSSIEEPTDNLDGTYTFFIASITGSSSFTFQTIPQNGAFGDEGSTSTVTNRSDVYLEEVTGDPADTTEAEVSITTDWIEKSGLLRSGSGINYIDWTITLNNNNRTIPAGSIITDTLPSGFLFLESASVMRNGNDPSTYGDIYSVVGQVFTYTFNSNETGVQVITFSTSVDSNYYKQQDVTSFANTATVTIQDTGYSDTSENVPVPTSLIAKTGEGYNRSNQLITWRMQVNSNGQAIQDAVITDTIGANREFYEDYGVRLNGGTGSITRVYSFDELDDDPNQYYFDSGELSIFLGELSASDMPVIRFQTRVTNPAHYAVNGTRNYSNTATLIGGGITLSASTGTQQINSQVLTKAGTGYRYNERILSWRITVNQNNMNMPAASVTDIIPAGQEYVIGSMLIGGALPGAGVLAVDDNNLTVTLGEISSQTIITFSTIVTDLAVFLETNGDVVFSNSSSLSSGITGAPVVNVSANQTVDNQAISKGLLTEYVPENSFIEWEVYINANQAPMENAVISDTLQEGLELNIESIELYMWNQDDNGARTIGSILSRDNYSFDYDYGTRVFLFYLPDGPQGYYLKFKTDITAAGRYSNTIEFTGEYDGSDNASSGYTVTTNDVELGAKGTNGSITVTKVDSGGNPIRTGAEFELLDSFYNLKATGTTDENGEVLFDRLKLRTYYIREKTPPLGYSLSSQVVMVTLTSENDEQRHQIVSYGNSLLAASITLRKTNTIGVGLAGGHYSLYYAGDTAFANSLVTVLSGAGGYIVFGGLGPGSYAVREVKPPAGYKGSNEVRYATLVLNEQDNSLAGVTVSEPFVNERSPDVNFGTIQLIKVDSKNNPLAGANIGLYSKEGELMQVSVSSGDGMVQFAEVPFSKYTIREIAAPKGYKLSDATLTCTVADSGKVTKASPYMFVNTKGSLYDLGLLPQTGSFWDSDLIIMIGGLLILVGTGFFVIEFLRRRKKNENVE